MTTEPSLRVISPTNPSFFASLTETDDGTAVRFFRLRSWRRQLPGKPGPAANRPPEQVQIFLGCLHVNDVPFHVVRDKVATILATLGDA